MNFFAKSSPQKSPQSPPPPSLSPQLLHLLQAFLGLYAYEVRCRPQLTSGLLQFDYLTSLSSWLHLTRSSYCNFRVMPTRRQLLCAGLSRVSCAPIPFSHHHLPLPADSPRQFPPLGLIVPHIALAPAGGSLFKH